MPELAEKKEKEAEAISPEEKKDKAKAKAISPEEQSELQEIEKFKKGVKASVENAESKQWGPDESERLPIDLARLGSEQAKVYQEFQERIKGFSDSVVISELASLKNAVHQSMLKFAQLEKKYNEIETDEDLSPKGKSKRLKEIQDVRSAISDELNSAMTKIEAFQEMAEAEGYRQESLSENEFSMQPGDQGSKSSYALYSEMKLSRLDREFSVFGSFRQFDSTLKREITEMDYDWLNRKYDGAMVRNDRATMYFIEQLMHNIQKNEMNYRSRKGTGHIRGTLLQNIEAMRKSRRDPSLNDTLSDLKYLHRKGREMRLRSHKNPSDKVFESMKKVWS